MIFAHNRIEVQIPSSCSTICFSSPVWFYWHVTMFPCFLKTRTPSSEAKKFKVKNEVVLYTVRLLIKYSHTRWTSASTVTILIYTRIIISPVFFLTFAFLVRDYLGLRVWILLCTWMHYSESQTELPWYTILVINCMWNKLNICFIGMSQERKLLWRRCFRSSNDPIQYGTNKSRVSYSDTCASIKAFGHDPIYTGPIRVMWHVLVPYGSIVKGISWEWLRDVMVVVLLLSWSGFWPFGSEILSVAHFRWNLVSA